MLNLVQLIGNLGADPEVAALPSGDKVVVLRLATSDRWKDKNTGEPKEKTEWHRVRVFNQNIVRVLQQYTHKGSRIYISGALRTRKYIDNSGVERYATEIVLEQFNGEVKLLDRAPDRAQPTPDDYGTTRNRESQAPASSGRGGYGLDDDIPF